MTTRAVGSLAVFCGQLANLSGKGLDATPDFVSRFRALSTFEVKIENVQFPQARPEASETLEQLMRSIAAEKPDNTKWPRTLVVEGAWPKTPRALQQQRNASIIAARRAIDQQIGRAAVQENISRLAELQSQLPSQEETSRESAAVQDQMPPSEWYTGGVVRGKAFAKAFVEKLQSHRGKSLDGSASSGKSSGREMPSKQPPNSALGRSLR